MQDKQYSALSCATSGSYNCHCA